MMDFVSREGKIERIDSLITKEIGIFREICKINKAVM